MHTRTIGVATAVVAWSISSAALGAVALKIDMHKIDENGIGTAIGTMTAKDGPAGLALTPHLKGLSAGPHGFHVHENPACESGEKDGKRQAGLAAGGHFDPQQTGRHLGPEGNGHLGDLPVLTVAEDGTADTPVTAPRLHAKDLKERALVIHAENDNYADKPGGARIACGVVK